MKMIQGCILNLCRPLLFWTLFLGVTSASVSGQNGKSNIILDYPVESFAGTSNGGLDIDKERSNLSRLTSDFSECFGNMLLVENALLVNTIYVSGNGKDLKDSLSTIQKTIKDNAEKNKPNSVKQANTYSIFNVIPPLPDFEENYSLTACFERLKRLKESSKENKDQLMLLHKIKSSITGGHTLSREEIEEVKQKIPNVSELDLTQEPLQPQSALNKIITSISKQKKEIDKKIKNIRSTILTKQKNIDGVTESRKQADDTFKAWMKGFYEYVIEAREALDKTSKDKASKIFGWIPIVKTHSKHEKNAATPSIDTTSAVPVIDGVPLPHEDPAIEKAKYWKVSSSEYHTEFLMVYDILKRCSESSKSPEQCSYEDMLELLIRNKDFLPNKIYSVQGMCPVCEVFLTSLYELCKKEAYFISETNTYQSTTDNRPTYLKKVFTGPIEDTEVPLSGTFTSSGEEIQQEPPPHRIYDSSRGLSSHRG